MLTRPYLILLETSEILVFDMLDTIMTFTAQ